MRFTTDYGTIEFLADTDDDVEILTKLISSLPERAENYYEDGDYDVWHGPNNGKTFSGSEYGKKMTVSFNR